MIDKTTTTMIVRRGVGAGDAAAGTTLHIAAAW
jgi:hypothetical protein